MYQKIKNTMVKVIDLFLVIILLLMVVFVFSGIIARYVLKHPFVWGEEIALLGQIWLTFIALGVLCCKYDHMVVDLVFNYLTGKKKLILVIINQILIILFFIVFAYSGVLVVDMTKVSVTPGLGVSVSMMYLPTVIGAALMLFFSVDLLVTAIKEYKDISRLDKKLEGQTK